MPNRFKIEIRRKQLKNDTFQNVIVDCVGGVPTYVLGNVTDTTWIDITNDANYVPQFDFNFNYTNTDLSKEKGTSSNILLSGSAKTTVERWINNTACSYLNTWEVRVTDILCAIIFPLYEMKGDNLKYCVGDGCKLELPLREINAPYHCLYITSIYDNWQGWFNGNVKNFPTFNVCIESYNNFGIIGSIAINGILTSVPFIGQILTSFNIVQDSDETCREILGTDNFYSSPKVYDILLNAAAKCGVTLDTIFDIGNELHNVCYYYPISGKYHKNNGDIILSPSTNFIWGNRIVTALDNFLNDVCTLTNSLWWIENNKLVIKYIEDLNNEPLLVDFNTFAIKPYDICYESNGEKYPASGNYTYLTDPKDSASNVILNRYNDRVSFTDGVGNTVFDGIKNKNTQFAATGFVCDGTISSDYFTKSFDRALVFGVVIIALLVALGLSLTGTFILSPVGIAIAAITTAWAILFILKISTLKNKIGCTQYEGSIHHIGNGEIDIQRLLMWDGVSLNLSKVKNYTPTINPYYNKNNDSYTTEYGVPNTRNFALMFDSNFNGSLYEKHEQTDNTLLNGYTNVVVKYKLPYCCEILRLFGIYEGGVKKLYYNAKLPNYNNWQSIHHITNISIQPANGYIEISGKLLRK